MKDIPAIICANGMFFLDAFGHTQYSGKGLIDNIEITACVDGDMRINVSIRAFTGFNEVSDTTSILDAFSIRELLIAINKKIKDRK